MVAEGVNERTTYLVASMGHIRQLAQSRMACREIPHESRAYSTLQQNADYDDVVVSEEEEEV
jgi:hypothetical protein